MQRSARPTALDRFFAVYARLFARPAFEGFNKLLLQTGLRGLGIMNWGSEYLSGERLAALRVIQQLDLDKEGSILVDVGANEGAFSQAILDVTKQLDVIAIEPIPETFARLSHRFRAIERVTVMNSAVGSRAASLTLYDHAGENGTEHATAFPSSEIAEGAARTVIVPVQPLDDLLADRRRNVCFLKIDVEGFEYEVLRGATGLLSEDSLRAVLLEFNAMNVDARVFAKDFREILASFQPNRILPGGRLLSLRAYGGWKEELFAYQNLLFTRSD